MDPTNQELAHDNLISIQQQRQQQELIKILTQHFHNQFYQLACSNQTNRGASNGLANQFCSSPSTLSPPNMPQNHAPPTTTTTAKLAAQSSGNQNHYPAAHGQNHSLSGPTRGLDLSCLELLTASTGPTNHSQLFHEQKALAVSQQGNPIASVNQLASLMDLSNPSGNMINPTYQFNIMNALAMNGASEESNRLALSLRQQSIIQAIRQQQPNHLEHGDANSEEEIEDQLQRTNPKTNSFKSVPNDGLNQDDVDTGVSGKSLLKFSINTILGRDSPQSNNQTDCETNTLHNDQTSGARKFSTFYNRYQTFARSAGVRYPDEMETGKRAVISESEAIDSSSDTNSLLAPTPVPQIDRPSSILSNQPVASHQLQDGSSFNTITTNTNAAISSCVPTTANSMARNNPQSLQHVTQAHVGGPHSLAPFLTNSTSFPWTVTSRGKPRRGMMRRAVFSDGQRVGLEKRFQLQKYISKPDRKKLAEKLGLRDSQVKIWFQNRRMKWRNSKERELLSAGGSREQTLPTRNNPNPDLSDVGETIRRLTSASNTSSATIPSMTPSNLTNK